MAKRKEDSKNPAAITPSRQHTRLAQSICQMLDPRSSKGGVLRVLTEPGGKVAWREGQSFGGVYEGRVDEPKPGQVVRADEKHLLIRGVGEQEEDFAHRAELTAPRGIFHAAAADLSGTPFSDGMTVSGDSISDKLKNDGNGDQGEYLRDIDGAGTRARPFFSEACLDSATYGEANLWATRNGSGRPVSVVIPETSIVRDDVDSAGRYVDFRFIAKVDGEDILHRMQPASHAKRPDGMAQISRYKRPSGKSDGAFDEKPYESVSLTPFQHVPVRRLLSQRPSRDGVIVPRLLGCAQLERLLINIDSASFYHVLIANSPMRLATGLNEEQWRLWQKISVNGFYATTASDANMKWVELAGASIDVARASALEILRAAEVAGMSPMLTQPDSDQRAFGQAVTKRRASVQAEQIAFGWASAIGAHIGDLNALEDGNQESEILPAEVAFSRDFGVVTPEALSRAKFFADLYKEGGIDRAGLWQELQSLGIPSEKIQMGDVLKEILTFDQRMEKQKEDRAVAEGYLAMWDNGMISSDEGRVELLAAIAGRFPDLAKVLAAEQRGTPLPLPGFDE